MSQSKPVHKKTNRSNFEKSKPTSLRTFQPAFVRARLALRDGGVARLTLAGLPYPRIFCPWIAADVLLALRAVGVEGPYCQFLESRSLTPAETDELHRSIVSQPLEETEALIKKMQASQWFLLDENVSHWTHLSLAQGVQVIRFGWGDDQPPRYETGCGRVEQWITLSTVITNALSAFRTCTMGQGFLRRERDLTDEDLVIGITDGPPILAVGSARDFVAGSAEGLSDPDRLELSYAGQALLVWAIAHQRLHEMYHAIEDVTLRLRLRAVTSYLARRKPVLEWTEPDFKLLDEVRRDLIAAAPLWRKAAQAGQPTSAPPQPMYANTLGTTRMGREEANQRARMLLESDHSFADQTARQWSEEIGCSLGLVSELPLWKALQEKKSRLKPKAPRTVALTERFLENIDGSGRVGRSLSTRSRINEVLDVLIEEQRSDDESQGVRRN